LNLGLIESNPWHDVKILGKVKPPKKTEHYTLTEIEQVLEALSGHLREQVIMAVFSAA
jgi:hypothetical protein